MEGGKIASICILQRNTNTKMPFKCPYVKAESSSVTSAGPSASGRARRESVKESVNYEPEDVPESELSPEERVQNRLNEVLGDPLDDSADEWSSKDEDLDDDDLSDDDIIERKRKKGKKTGVTRAAVLSQLQKASNDDKASNKNKDSNDDKENIPPPPPGTSQSQGRLPYSQMNTPTDMKNVLAQTLTMLHQEKKGWKRLGFCRNVIQPLVSSGKLRFNGSSLKDLADRYQRKVRNMMEELKTQEEDQTDASKQMLNVSWKFGESTQEITEMVNEILDEEERFQQSRNNTVRGVENTDIGDVGDFGDTEGLPELERRLPQNTQGYMARLAATKSFEENDGAVTTEDPSPSDAEALKVSTGAVNPFSVPRNKTSGSDVLQFLRTKEEDRMTEKKEKEKRDEMKEIRKRQQHEEKMSELRKIARSSGSGGEITIVKEEDPSDTESPDFGYLIQLESLPDVISSIKGYLDTHDEVSGLVRCFNGKTSIVTNILQLSVFENETVTVSIIEKKGNKFIKLSK